MSEAQSTGSNAAGEAPPIRLRDALRKARIEAADRTGVVVDLRDAEVARLEILNEALDPLFKAVVEATEESVVNALVAAQTMTGADGYRFYSLPHAELRTILKHYGRLEGRRRIP